MNHFDLLYKKTETNGCPTCRSHDFEVICKDLIGIRLGRKPEILISCIHCNTHRPHPIFNKDKYTQDNGKYTCKKCGFPDFSESYEINSLSQLRQMLGINSADILLICDNCHDINIVHESWIKEGKIKGRVKCIPKD